jgi:glutathione S-transferase
MIAPRDHPATGPEGAVDDAGQATQSPLRVYGSEVSYFTGKLEGYLRYKEIPYERVSWRPRPVAGEPRAPAQMPALELPDGRFLTDTTPIIAWLEQRHPRHPVVPDDPLQAFFAWLLEDYADEWLWRPAMHYRWDYPADAHLLRRKLVDELTQDVRLPRFVKRRLIHRRQHGLFTRGDGVSPSTWDHVEATYHDTLRRLSAIFEERPFLLGARPCVADFGFFASMFRHFSQDPTPGTIMRETAPAVFQWVATLWNARGSRLSGDLLSGIPQDWGPLLDDVGAAYLPHLCANAEAWKRRARRFDVTLQGVRFEGLRTARYRVWCLEGHRARFEALPAAAREQARALLERHGCWEPLWRVVDPQSGVDPEGRAPFGREYSMTGLRDRVD